MRMFRKLMVLSGMAIATAVFPAVAQQGQQPAPAEDHGAHHGGTDQQSGQQEPGGGMMGNGKGGMMGQGRMMDKGMMDGCPMTGDTMGPGKRDKGHGMMMHSRPIMEGRLAYIKTDLEITEAQTAAWDAYAVAVRARHSAMEGVHADMMKAKKGGALERLDARIKVTESKLESLKALKPATEALYAVLTDAQKEKADQLLGGGCGMM